MDKKLAVFDFDGTLITGDSLISFAKFSVGTPRLILAMLRSAGAIMRWKLGHASSGAAKEVLFGHLFGEMPYEKFVRLGEKFADRLALMERQSVVERLRYFVREDIPVVIVSASMPEWVRPWAGRHGVAEVIGTLPEIGSDGRLTGRFSTMNCRGEEKIRRLKNLFPDLDSRETWAFGDSDGDAPLLACATHPEWIR